MEHDGCVGCKHADKADTEYPCNECKSAYSDEYIPLSYADVIRAMSDEELATVIKCPYKCETEKCIKHGKGKSCIDCTLAWLKEKSKGG